MIRKFKLWSPLVLEALDGGLQTIRDIYWKIHSGNPPFTNHARIVQNLTESRIRWILRCLHMKGLVENKVDRKQRAGIRHHRSLWRRVK